PVVKKVDHVELQFGDVLLLQGPEERIIHLGKSHDFLLLGGVSPAPYRPRKAPLAAIILLAVVLLAALRIFPIMLSASLGALLMVLSRCLTPKEAYESIDWSIIVLIAGTLPLGLAMEKTGTAQFLAELIIRAVGHLGPWVALGAVFLITFALTEIMSHAAAAVLVAPIAFNTALDLAANPKPFFLAVAVAASSCFMTPMSPPSPSHCFSPSDQLRPNNRAGSLFLPHQGIDPGRADEVVFRQAFDGVCVVGDPARVVADLQIRMMILPMRNPGGRVDESHCPVIVLEVKGLPDPSPLEFPTFQPRQQSGDFLFAQGRGPALAGFAVPVGQFFLFVVHKSSPSNFVWVLEKA
ncbi:MAG: SLC13 family permease, partial [Desulfuromonadales bacterium]